MTDRQLGHYEVLQELGRGGMGQVFLAHDTKLRRQVALKTLPSKFAADPDRLSRFRREAQVVAALNHPNIVTIYSVEEAEGTHFLTMELVKGSTLDQLIPERGLPLDRFFSLAVPMASALSAAEDSSVVHRDLKPANVMVSHSGTVKVLDFGLARLFEPEIGPNASDVTTELKTTAGRLLGTLPYMSPEHVQGLLLDHRSDIFSLGITYYQMITGDRPFSGKTSADLISSILRDCPSTVSDLRRELPRHLGRIVRHCLEKDPERRYQTAKDLRNDLAELEREVAGEETRTLETRVKRKVNEPTPGTDPKSSQLRRNLVWLAAPLAIGVLAFAAAGIWKSLRPDLPAAAPMTVELAVLPFVDHLSDPRDAYLAEGLSAGLRSRLDEIGGVRVVGRKAISDLDPDELEATRVAKRFSLTHVLEGDVSDREGHIRVVPRLIDGASGIVLWSRPLTGNREALLSLERELAAELAAVLKIPLSRSERLRLDRDPTASPKAYEYYLKGQRRLRDRDQRPEFAVESFRQALRLDDGFALAHVGLSEALRTVYLRDQNAEVLAEAESAAERAIEIDPELPAAHLVRAQVFRTTGRHEASAAELEDILASHPKPSEAYRQLAFNYKETGDTEQALACFRAAVNLDPESWSAWNSLGVLQLEIGDYAAARSALERAAQYAPVGIDWPQQNLAAAGLYEGDYEAAIEAYERIGAAPRDVELVSNIGTAYFFLGDLERAEDLYRLAVEINPRDAASHRNLGDVYFRLDKSELARAEYRQALDLVDAKLADSPTNIRLRLSKVLYAAKADECDIARPVADELWQVLEIEATSAHKLAQTWALCGDEVRALAALRRGFELGLSPKRVQEEDEFRSLSGRPEFEALFGAGADG